MGWSVIVFCVPSTLCCGFVCDCVLCPCYTVLWVGLCSISLLHCVVGWSVTLVYSVSLLHCAVGWFVFYIPSTLCCWLVCDPCVFCVPSTLCCGLICDCVLCPFYTVLWVCLCLCYVSLLHCVVGRLVFVFCVPYTLCCGLVCDCVLCPIYTVLWVGL